MAPKVVDVDYLAFYQTGAFGDSRRWQIDRFAEVKGYELTTRGELMRDEPDHPRANEEYYKIQLGPLQTREAPIKADKWKRITFLYTTGQLFNRAKIINDLVVKSDERDILLNILRERIDRSRQYLPDNKSDQTFLSDPRMLEFFGSLLLDTGDDDDSSFNI
jgi:hypothetical protein